MIKLSGAVGVGVVERGEGLGESGVEGTAPEAGVGAAEGAGVFAGVGAGDGVTCGEEGAFVGKGEVKAEEGVGVLVERDEGCGGGTLESDVRIAEGYCKLDCDGEREALLERMGRDGMEGELTILDELDLVNWETGENPLAIV